MRILFSITTYNRSYFLERLIKQISENREHDVCVNIIDDASDKEHELKNKNLSKKYNRHNIDILYTHKIFHCGKKKYWKVINKIFKLVEQDQEFDYYFLLPDDFILTENFINESIRQYENVKDDKKICLSLFIEKERIDSTNWVDKQSELILFGQDHVYLTHWMDMCIVSGIEFYRALNFKMNPISEERWQEYDAIGSGVGAQITKRLNDKYSLYHVSQSLCYEEEHESKMNPNRTQSYTIQNNRRDYTQKVYAGIASIPSREVMLKHTIYSLIHQVDKIFVMLNGYENIPDFLINNPKIEVFRSQEFGDYGDAGKLYKSFAPDVVKIGAYFLTCDDDLVYPGDYAYTMINHIENNNRKAVIGLHGVILNEHVKNYYGDRRIISCLNNNPTSTFVHILGTGAMAFHTSLPNCKFNVYKLTEYKNMADIHFSLCMQEWGTPMLCVKHDAHWLRYMEPKETIFDTHKNDCSLQTKLINSISWEIHTIEEQYKGYEIGEKGYIGKLI